VLENGAPPAPPKGDSGRAAQSALYRFRYTSISAWSSWCRVIDGVMKPKQTITMMRTTRLQIEKVGVFSRPRTETWLNSPPARSLLHRRHQGGGDCTSAITITELKLPTPLRSPVSAIRAGRLLRPVPVDANDFETLREAMVKLL